MQRSQQYLEKFNTGYRINTHMYILYGFLALTKYTCPKTQFTCDDLQCIPGSLVCDGKGDCEDGSDEQKGCSGTGYLF